MRCLLFFLFLLVALYGCKPSLDNPAEKPEEGPRPVKSDTTEGHFLPPVGSCGPKKDSITFGAAAPHAFYMIAASLHSPEEAEKYRETWQAKGYDAQILKSQGTPYRVAIARFSRWRQATGFLQEHYEAGDTTLWILGP